MNSTYASGNFTCMWNFLPLNAGWGDDQFLSVTPNGPLVETSIGADGNMSVSQLADQGGVIEMTFKQTADALARIDEIAATLQTIGIFYDTPFAGLFTFEDPLGVTPSFVAWNAVLVDKGAHTHQKVMGERTVTWHCEKLIFGNPVNILPDAVRYFKR